MISNQNTLRAAIREDIDSDPTIVNSLVLVAHILGRSATQAELTAANTVVKALLNGEFDCKEHVHDLEQSEVGQFINTTYDEELIRSVISDISVSQVMRDKPEIYG